jgi:CheY-like chemotaxis protein
MNKEIPVVLLVEDNPADMLLTREAFKGLYPDPQVYVAEDGEEALKFLCRDGKYSDAPRPDLVLLDLNLPRKSGEEVLKVIRERAELKLIPVIIFTSSAMPREVTRAYNLCANGFVTKPKDLDSTFQAIRNIHAFWLRTATLPSAALPV